jgi:glycine/D-amino acid oxidase-like deaminating enzyme
MYLAGLEDPDGCALVDPARLVWGLRSACVASGVRLHEHTQVVSLEEDGTSVRVRTPRGTVRAGRVLLATAAFPPLLRRLRARVVPVWDYALVTEPLEADRRQSLGWRGRQGISDAGNRFHYYRLTADDRLLFGGYDALYHFGNDTDPRRAQHPPTFALLTEHLLRTFPQLEGVRVTHTWGGVIDTCSRFSPFWGTALRRRVAYVLGFTGLGVGASHFGARTALDLLDGRDTERTRLRMVQKKPVPFPPEPLRWAGIQLTRRALARADARGGRRGPWLRLLDAAGLGFDS